MGGATTGDELFARLRALPGYGDEKSKIFVAILAKRMGVRPQGWEHVAGPFADPEPRSVADIDSPEALEKVRQWKRQRRPQAEPSRTDHRHPAPGMSVARRSSTGSASSVELNGLADNTSWSTPASR